MKDEHPYAIGLMLMAVGLLGMVGSITGGLAAMAAALFDPSELTGASTSSSPSSTSSAVSGVAGVTSAVTTGESLVAPEAAPAGIVNWIESHFHL